MAVKPSPTSARPLATVIPPAVKVTAATAIINGAAAPQVRTVAAAVNQFYDVALPIAEIVIGGESGAVIGGVVHGHHAAVSVTVEA